MHILQPTWYFREIRKATCLLTFVSDHQHLQIQFIQNGNIPELANLESENLYLRYDLSHISAFQGEIYEFWGETLPSNTSEINTAVTNVTRAWKTDQDYMYEKQHFYIRSSII